MLIQKITRYPWLSVILGILAGIVLTSAYRFTPELPAVQKFGTRIISPASKMSSTDSNMLVAKQLSDAFVSAASRVNPSVVTIFTESEVKVHNQQMFQSPFGEFFGDNYFKKFLQTPDEQGNFKRMGLGSGVIIDEKGIILTNNHVVNEADNIKVRLMDGREFEAKVKGTDEQTDLAVITIDVKNLQPIELGNSDNASVGMWVLAIGSPLNPQLEHSVTAGIISAKGRSGVGLSQYEDFIQTDAAINPGNSGGALVNLDGSLIGINSAIMSETGGFQGIGFAIPVNLARKVMDDIINKGKVERAWLGVAIQNITPEMAKALKLKSTNGVIVSNVERDSPADKAGLKMEDIILELDGREVSNSVALSTRVANSTPGENMTLKILRNGEMKEITVKLAELTARMQESGERESRYSKIGIEVSNITPEIMQHYQLSDNPQGVIITGIDQNGIAAQVGIQEGDIIAKVNRKDVHSVKEFDEMAGNLKSGDNVLFFIHRGGASLFVAFTMPD